jgi:hypothetical protein
VSAASNTRECILQHRGKRIIGCLFGQLPRSRADISSGTVSIILDDGSALTFSASGAYWTDSKADVDWAIGRFRKTVEETGRLAAEAIALAEGVADAHATCGCRGR